MANYVHIPEMVNDQQGTLGAPYVGARSALGCGDDATTTTKYLANAGNHASAQRVLGIAHRAGYIQNLRAVVKTAAGSSQTYTLTVQKSSDGGTTWADTALTCQIAGASAKAASDVSHQVSVAAGDCFAIKAVGSGSCAADICFAQFEIV